MQVRVFEAEDMRSALNKVKQALGPDALILSSRSVYKNKFGFGGKPWIEVTAAVDDRDRGAPPAGGGEPSGSFPGDRTARSGRERRPITYNRKGSFKRLLETDDPPPVERSSRERALMLELEQMKQSFQAMVQEFSEVKSEWKKQLASSISDSACQDIDLDYSDRMFNELYELGVGVQVLQLIARRINRYPVDAFREDPEGFFEGFIAESIRMENPLARHGSGQKRLAFIGPTGVGKTTTIAKIAGNYILDSGKKVALATIDNYRIAAVEQLKIYGHIMNVPVEVARTPEQLREIFGRHLDKDLILVDTAGRNPRDEMSRQELSAFLDPALNINNHLVLSAATGQSDLFRIIDRFRHLKLGGLVLTKLDECDLFGNILNAQVYSEYPLSFLTTGQRVPEDLLLPEPHELARRILKPNEVPVNGISSRPGSGRNTASVAS